MVILESKLNEYSCLNRSHQQAQPNEYSSLIPFIQQQKCTLLNNSCCLPIHYTTFVRVQWKINDAYSWDCQ